MSFKNEVEKREKLKKKTVEKKNSENPVSQMHRSWAHPASSRSRTRSIGSVCLALAYKQASP